MNTKQLLALFGLKYNPFLPGIPVESLWSPPAMESFLFRVENLVMEGGFALVCGEPCRSWPIAWNGWILLSSG